MNKSIKSIASSALVGALFFASAPMTLAAGRNQVGIERCQQMTGREQSRCIYVLEHSGRLRVRATTKAVTRSSTVRQRRVIRQNTITSNVRRRGDKGLVQLKRHYQAGGNARRQINTRDEAARDSCKFLEGTKKYTCIRKNLRMTAN
jgi:hypothetical protein